MPAPKSVEEQLADVANTGIGRIYISESEISLDAPSITLQDQGPHSINFGSWNRSRIFNHKKLQSVEDGPGYFDIVSDTTNDPEIGFSLMTGIFVPQDVDREAVACHLVERFGCSVEIVGPQRTIRKNFSKMSAILRKRSQGVTEVFISLGVIAVWLIGAIPLFEAPLRQFHHVIR